MMSLQQRPVGPVGPVQYDGNLNKLKSVPSSMLTDKYSFLGCLKVLKEVIGDKRHKNQILSVYDLDKDLTQMGLSFIKDNRLIYRFQSPFAEMPCRVQDIDMFVPNEYLTNVHIREKLAEIKTSKYNEDLLFWMFYSNPNDRMQMLAAEELFQRNWKFHKEEKIWISRTRNIEARVKNSNYEEGTFMVWDVESWKKVPRDMKVEYAKLAPDYPVSSTPRLGFDDDNNHKSYHSSVEEKQTLPDVGNSFADWQAQSRPDRAPATNQNEYTSRIEQTIPPMSIPDIMRMVLKRQAEGKVARPYSDPSAISRGSL